LEGLFHFWGADRLHERTEEGFLFSEIRKLPALKKKKTRMVSSAQKEKGRLSKKKKQTFSYPDPAVWAGGGTAILNQEKKYKERRMRSQGGKKKKKRSSAVERGRIDGLPVLFVMAEVWDKYFRWYLKNKRRRRFRTHTHRNKYGPVLDVRAPTGVHKKKQPTEEDSAWASGGQIRDGLFGEGQGGEGNA